MPDSDKEFPKIMEIHRNYDGADPMNMLARIPEALNKAPEEYRPYEIILRKLSDSNFNIFKSKIMNRGKKDRLRGYQQFVDTLNELLGYEYLEEQGYRRIELIGENQDGRAPDLQAVNGGNIACLLEVKTISDSDDDIAEWIQSTQTDGFRQGMVEQNLPRELANKMEQTLIGARNQLQEFPQPPGVQHVVCLVIKLDLMYTLSKSNWNELDEMLRAVSRRFKDVKIVWKGVGFGATESGYSRWVL